MCRARHADRRPVVIRPRCEAIVRGRPCAWRASTEHDGKQVCRMHAPRLPRTTAPKAKRRFTEHTPPGNPYVLAADHPAVTEGRTLFRKRVVPSAEARSLFKSGEHNRKIGARVVKGAWAGFPVFTLTLEERATCPRDCAHFRDCYGNNMNWSVRVTADEMLTDRLEGEIWRLAMKHPHGFVVRLHVLGDFYSTDYVQFWHSMLRLYEPLRIYGYTARSRSSDIGAGIAAMNRSPRCFIRFSDGEPSEFRAVTVENEDQAREAGVIVCPVQTNKTACCSTCALCWSTTKTIAFLRH
jgi:hypothetical protein